MSRLMRMAYGHGGTRLERIRVAAPHVEYPPAPRWLRLLLLVVWLAIPALVSRYAPTATRPTTVIDTSRLDVQPLPPPAPPIIRETPRLKPAEPPPSQVEKAPRPQEQTPEEAPPPAINRPSVARAPDVMDYQPRIARERARTGEESTPFPAPRVRREMAPGESPLPPTAIARTRGAAPTEPVPAPERPATLRRAPAAESSPREVAMARRQVTARDRSSDLGEIDGSSPRITASKERAQAAGAGDGGAGTASVGLTRGGVSLMSLDICAGPREEEDAVRAVLGIVGSRQSCSDERGTFQFRGTRRVSSFNLIIYPAKGRRPSNRCEELENAYRCLKAR